MDCFIALCAKKNIGIFMRDCNDNKVYKQWNYRTYYPTYNKNTLGPYLKMYSTNTYLYLLNTNLNQ